MNHRPLFCSINYIIFSKVVTTYALSNSFTRMILGLLLPWTLCDVCVCIYVYGDLKRAMCVYVCVCVYEHVYVCCVCLCVELCMYMGI